LCYPAVDAAVQSQAFQLRESDAFVIIAGHGRMPGAPKSRRFRPLDFKL
jgi:hypothetical protein